ncbi:hypothetical protein CHS0354_027547 [Potamilus streckersoni]|uniref:Uncharacterized protein n=1 Tax=Potamilus streckersoni TaxID=2493646 RepID=A0AAE0S0U2_9BIVA|nr:hypothetical protein CHS0354_027547 [Potamilus streckersoni]
METIYIANIRQSCVETVVFDQVKYFTKLSATLARVYGVEKKSTCSKVLRDLIKIQETQVVPPVTMKLMDSIKTAAFGGSKPCEISEKDNKINASVEKEEMFTPTLVKKWNRRIENMHKTIKSHQQVVTQLQVVQELTKHYMGAGGNVVQNKKETILSKKTKSQSKLQKTIDNFKDNQSQYWSMKYWQLIAEENKLRQNLKQDEAKLRKDIEKRVELEIQKGLTNQEKICQAKQICEIDSSKVAHDIFNFTSNVYAIKLPPSSGCFKKPTPPPELLIPCEERSEFALAYGPSNRSARRRNLGLSENIYVTCVTSEKTGTTGHLNIREGQMIKQKLTSFDGKLAFGWCRTRKFSPKRWGFYSTSSVSGAVKSDENN